MRKHQRLLTLAVMALLVSGLHAQTWSSGPDVIVGEITGPSNYSSVGGIDAFSVGTTSCNIGDTNLSWIANTNMHPVIGQNLYRLHDGKFVQIGMSWLKHGFASLQGNVCNTCTGTGNSQALGVGCSDPYSSGLNGSQSGLGARSEVNAATGVFPFPRVLVPPYSGSVARRLQAKHTDLDPATYPGALYFVEAQYVTQDDAAAGNKNNNASYRQCTFSGGPGEYTMSLTGPTERTKQAVEAWAAVDPSVVIHHEDIPNDGRITIAFKATALGGGMYRYVYAVHNLNSDRSVGGFSVALPAGATVSNVGFHDVDYHSGEVFNGNDWLFTQASNGVSWNVDQTYAQNVNANALRWGSTYTFWFDSDAVAGDVTLDLFKPGTPASVTIPAFSVPTPDWQTNQANAHLDIDGQSNTANSGPIQVTKNVGATATYNLFGLTNAPYDVFINFAPAVPNALVLPDGQIVNIDLTAVPLIMLGNGFGLSMPATGLSLTTGPLTAGTVTSQLAVLDPGAPYGISLSAACQLDVIPCAAASYTHSLGDDNNVQVFMGPGGDHECISGITFYGTTYDHAFINSNGFVSFTSGNGDFTSSVSEFTSQMPRIAGMWTDLSPNVGGTVSSSSTIGGLLTISFVNVPQYGTGGQTTSSFDIVFDTAAGSCSIENYAPHANHGDDTLVGITPGTAVGNGVTWSSFAGAGVQSGNAAQAYYEFTTNSAPGGFTSIEWPNSDGSSFIVN